MSDPTKIESSDPTRASEEKHESIAPEIEHTGERFLPGTMGSAEIAYDHIARYRLAERYATGKKTLDLGCGAGYGTHSLARVARSVLGVDLSEEAMAYAAWSYEAPNLRYEVGDVTALSYPDGDFDTAVSFEVIEHLERPEDLVKEVRRLLKQDGVFVVSTPDKRTYSVERNQVNPHHLKEMYPLEFRELLERHFRHVRMYWQGALAGSIVAPDRNELSEEGHVILESAQFSLPDPAFGQGAPTALYMIAICTNGLAPEALERPYMILDRDRQIYEEHAHWHSLLGRLVMYHNYSLNRERQEANKQRARETNQRLRKANEELRKAREKFGRLRHEMDSMQGTRGWRIAQKLNGFVALVRRVLGRG